MLISPAAVASSAVQQVESGVVQSEGLAIHFRVVGAGPPLILVHGWGSDAKRNWEQTGWVGSFSDKRRVIVLDIRGHGSSDKPLESAMYSYHRMANDVLAVLDHLEIQKADFIGYSMGAFIGAHLLGHHSYRFTAMVLGGIGDETPESISVSENIAIALRAEDPASITDPIGRAVRAFVDSNPDHSKMDREVLAISALQMWPEGFPIRLAGEGLKLVDIPVLAVVGADDMPYAATVSDFTNAVPGGRLELIPQHDHLSVVTAPEFKRAAFSFLGVESGQAGESETTP
ncbi:MAG: alpha/beta hydrolase [Pseudomonadota bacterium]